MRTRVYRTNGEGTDAIYYDVVLVTENGMEIVDVCMDEQPAMALALATSTLTEHPAEAMASYSGLYGRRIAEFANGKRLV